MKDVLYIMEQLSKHGEAYIVGGSVRDIVMNIQPHDIDIATNVSMEKIEKMFKTIDIGKNKDFGVLVVRHNNISYEVAHYRCDGKYSDGRRPDEVQLTQSLEDDVKRRDFTINGMAMDLHGNVVDYVNGLEDIQNKIIRCIGDPNKRIAEDKLRMLRAIRFATRFDFTIEPITFRAIQDNAHSINDISTERIRDELYKMAEQTGECFVEAILLLKATGLLKQILPEIDCMDKYEHTITTHPEGFYVVKI